MAATVSPTSFWLRRYAALVRAGWLVDLQYRAAIAIWLTLGVAQPLFLLAIWWGVAGGGEVGGYGQAAFARYFFAVMLVDQLTLAWDIWYIDGWIRGGELNYRITRPMNPIHEAIADNLAYKSTTVAVVLFVWVSTAAFWPSARLPFEPGRWALALLAVIPAAAMRFLISYFHGLLAFWTTRATGLFELHFGLSAFLSGRIAPLSLFPPLVGSIAGGLWFPYMLAFPVEVLTGAVDTPAAYLEGIAWQLLWLAAWFAAYRLAWSRGLRRYGAVGG